MASLEELRAQLGGVDDKIVELYEERMKLCEEIGICKIENGYKTFDRCLLYTSPAFRKLHYVLPVTVSDG